MLDSLGGRRLPVYGTPYPSEYLVKLWAAVLGLNVDEDDYDFAERAVEWDDFEINVPTALTTRIYSDCICGSQ